MSSDEEIDIENVEEGGCPINQIDFEGGSSENAVYSATQHLISPVKKVAARSRNHYRRGPWLKEEISTFHVGLDKFGKKWTKIAELLPCRSVQQVRSYGKKHFKKIIDNDRATIQINSQSDVVFIVKSTFESDEDIDIDINDDDDDNDNYRSKQKQNNNGDVFQYEEQITSKELDYEESKQSNMEQMVDNKNREINVKKDKDSSLLTENTESTINSKDTIKYLSDCNETSEDTMDIVKETTQKVPHTSLEKECLTDCLNAPLVNSDGEAKQQNEGRSPVSENGTCAEDNMFATVTCETICPNVNGDVSPKSNIYFTNNSDENCSNSLDDTPSLVDKLETFPIENACNSTSPSISSQTKNIASSSGEISCSSSSSTCTTTIESQVGSLNERRPACNGTQKSDLPCLDTQARPIPLGHGTVTLDEADNELVSDPTDTIALPIEEVNIDQTTISDIERKHNIEFFNGSSVKTPERYVKIRNTILNLWLISKPNYLYKMKVRQSLRACGDVNAIGRIHDFLEQLGAINFGCEETLRSNYNKPPRPVRIPQNDILRDWVGGLRPRKERRMLDSDNWIDTSESEGMTIEHLSGDASHLIRNGEPQRTSSTTATPKKRKPPTVNPFKLIPCRTFRSTSAVPFTVSITQSALVVLDFHSHLSSSEVIGLIGGRYIANERHLEVIRISPCENVGSDMQCEMDAVSQTRAMADLHDNGLNVVGWYHSHPTFAATPSIRDIETQTSFQKWFSRDGAPFMGIIVSPFYCRHGDSQSTITCLTVSDQLDPSNTHLIPYKFDFGITNDLDNVGKKAWLYDELKLCLDIVPGSESFLQKEFYNSTVYELLMRSIMCRHGENWNENNLFDKIKEILNLALHITEQ